MVVGSARLGGLTTERLTLELLFDDPSVTAATSPIDLVGGEGCAIFAAPIPELADHGYAQGTAVAAGKIEAPLAGLGIVEAQGQKFEMASWAIGPDLRKIGAAIPNLSNDDSAV